MVCDLRRYPVKSMLGESIAEGRITDRGLDGDRSHALVHTATGKVVSAKHPRLWRAMLTLSAILTPEGVRIVAPEGMPAMAPEGQVVPVVAPGGGTIAAGDPRTDEFLSKLLGYPVSITTSAPESGELDRARPEAVLDGGVDAEVPLDVVRFGSMAPAGTFFDFAPIHLMTTATIARIRALHSGGAATAIRYRPNIVIATPEDGFVEDGWLGRHVSIGDEVVLRIVARTPRCAVPTLAHGGLPPDTGALRTLADHHRIMPMSGMAAEPCAGAYAVVVRTGRVCVGDAVHVE